MKRKPPTPERTGPGRRWPPGPRRTERIEVALTDDERELLRYLAKRDGVTVSEWIRARMREAE